ncbi:MAG: FAD:protein FMN transferase [Lachnospirales bacterium]
MKKIIFALFFLLLMCGCEQEKYTTEYLDVFDTYSTITIYTNKKDEFDEITKELHTKLLNLNKQFDIYNNYKDINNIKTINDNAGIKPVKVQPETLELIKAGKYAYEKTNKTVNIAMGSVLNIWHNYRENALNNNVYAIPTNAELIEASKHTDINSIVIDENNSTVFIKDKYTSIDVGAIAKGYAADYAVKYLKSKGIKIALINLGGNVIAINDKDKESFKTGIVSPDNNDEYIYSFDLSNQSAVTSGNYQRYYDYNGKRYHHIVDSKTLFPSENNKEVTVVTNSSLEGDMFSTALFILPYDEGIKLAKSNNLKVMWIDKNDKQYLYGIE